jgi:hypothetical protein
LNLNFLIKKNHIFKKRLKKYFNNIYGNLNTGIYNLIQIRFEFIYLRVFKKIFRKKYLKKRPINAKTKF